MIKRDVGDDFIELFAREHLKDYFYTLVYANPLNDEEDITIVGNCEGKDSIINLANGLFSLLNRHFLENKKEDKYIFDLINNLKNTLDRIIYYENYNNNIISSFNAMKKSDEYLKESKILDNGLVEEINIDEDDKWWK